MRRTIAVICLACLLAGCDTTVPTADKTAPAPHTAARPSYSDSTPAEPDNTAVNERDRNPDAKTPIDQDETQRDVKMTADIRRSVLALENLSVNGRNVKIITADGKVTLRGPVNSKLEKESIESIAAQLAGKDNVTSEIEVKEP